MIWLVAIFALLAAAFFGLTSVIQQVRAEKQDSTLNLKPQLIINLFKDKIWLISIATSFIGYLFQALALGKGSLILVQPILVTGLIFALVIAAGFVKKKMLNLKEWLSSVAVCLGVVVLLISAHPSGGVSNATTNVWLLTIICCLLAIGILGALSMLFSPVYKSVLQAGAAGVSNALAAVFIKGQMGKVVTAYQRHESIMQILRVIFSSWETYALIGSYLLVLIFVQSSFQCGPISWSLPTLTVANPVASLIMGIVSFKEHINHSGIATFFIIGGFILLTIGVVVLARLESDEISNVSLKNHALNVAHKNISHEHS